MNNSKISEKNTSDGLSLAIEKVLEATLVPRRAIKTISYGKVSKDVKYSQIVVTPFWERN